MYRRHGTPFSRAVSMESCERSSYCDEFGRGDQHSHGRLFSRKCGRARNIQFCSPNRVWRALNRPMRKEQDSKTYRQEMIDGWQQEGRLGHPGTRQMEARKQLLFSSGGLYEGEDHFARAQMVDAGDDHRPIALGSRTAVAGSPDSRSHRR